MSKLVRDTSYFMEMLLDSLTNMSGFIPNSYSTMPFDIRDKTLTMQQTFLIILSLKQCIRSIRCCFHPGILHCDMLPMNISSGPLTVTLKEQPQLIIISAVALQEN